MNIEAFKQAVAKARQAQIAVRFNVPPRPTPRRMTRREQFLSDVAQQTPAQSGVQVWQWDAAKGEYVGFETLDGGISVRAEGS